MRNLEWNMDDALAARFEEDYEDGLTQEREFVAIKPISMGLKFADIQKATDLPIQRLEELATDVQKI